MMRASSFSMLALACALAVQPAWAQNAPVDQRSVEDEAAQKYQEGSKLLAEGQPGRALVALHASLRLLPSANTELLIGHAQRQLGRLGDAMTSYERVVRVSEQRIAAGESRFAPTLEDARRWIGELRAALAEIVVIVDDGADATVIVDGVAVPLDPANDGSHRARLWHEPGRLVVQLQRRDQATSQTTDAHAGATATVRFQAQPRATPAMPFDPTRPPPPMPGAFGPAARMSEPPVKRSKAPPVASWITGGIGLVGLGLFIGFGVAAEAKASTLRECAPSCDPSDPEKRAAADEGKKNALAANVSLGIGLAGLVTGGIIWAVSATSNPKPRSEPRALSFDVAPGSARLRLTF